MMKVLLMNPPTGAYIREDRCQSSTEDLVIHKIRCPIDLMSIAGILKKNNISCLIRDYPAERKNIEFVKKDITEYSPDIVIINITTPTISQDLKIVEIIKRINKNIITVGKSPHFLVFDIETLQSSPYLDVVIRGESEFTCLELCTVNNYENIKGITYRNNDKIIKNIDRPFIEDLNILPYPSRDLINNNLYLRFDTGCPQTTILANRGCPYKCIFCLTNLVAGKKLRFRSPENILREIIECFEKYKIKDFLFSGDTFTANKEWVIVLCEKIIKQNLKINWVCNSRVDTVDKEMLNFMKKAGCWGISIGIESGNQHLLNKMNKNITLYQAKETIKHCKEIGIVSLLYFILGLPLEDKNTLKDSLSFANKSQGDLLEIHFVYPFPGTELYKIVKEYNLIPENIFLEGAYAKPVMDTLFLKKKDLISYKRKMLLSFYFRAKFIIFILLRIKSPKIFLNYLKASVFLIFRVIASFKKSLKKNL